MAKKRKSKKKKKKAASASEAQAAFPRIGWSRSPVQRPHSTPKGKKGYDRKRSKDELRHEVDRPE